MWDFLWPLIVMFCILLPLLIEGLCFRDWVTFISMKARHSHFKGLVEIKTLNQTEIIFECCCQDSNLDILGSKSAFQLLHRVSVNQFSSKYYSPVNSEHQTTDKINHIQTVPFYCLKRQDI